jgi:hypothetical protein
VIERSSCPKITGNRKKAKESKEIERNRKRSK